MQYDECHLHLSHIWSPLVLGLLSLFQFSVPVSLPIKLEFTSLPLLVNGANNSSGVSTPHSSSNS